MKIPADKCAENLDHEQNGTGNGSSRAPAVNTVPEAVRDALTHSAIDAMFGSQEQTYEDFLRSFPHLTVGEFLFVLPLLD